MQCWLPTLLLLGILLASQAVPLIPGGLVAEEASKQESVEAPTREPVIEPGGGTHADYADLAADVRTQQHYEEHQAAPWGSDEIEERDEDVENALEEERGNFLRFDEDHNERVDIDEWLHVLLANDVDNVAAQERWRGHFADGDIDKDGSLTWKEWQKMLFHEAPQHPTYIDGHSSDAVETMDENTLLTAFEDADVNRNSLLDAAELLTLLKGAHERYLEHTGHPSEVDIVEEDLNPLAEEVMRDLDKDRNGAISPEEWLGYGAVKEHPGDTSNYDEVAREVDEEY